MGVAADRRLQLISVPEIAEFTTLAIERRDAFRGKRINIASDELTPPEMAKVISEASGRKLTYVPVPIDQLRKQSEDFAKMFDWFNRVGYSVNIARLKQEYPQVHWRTFRQWASQQDWSKLFPGSSKG